MGHSHKPSLLLEAEGLINVIVVCLDFVYLIAPPVKFFFLSGSNLPFFFFDLLFTFSSDTKYVIDNQNRSISNITLVNIPICDVFYKQDVLMFT